LTTSGRAAAKRLAGRRRAKLAGMLEALPVSERRRVVDALALLAEAAHEHP
jgi:hypothetical protein